METRWASSDAPTQRRLEAWPTMGVKAQAVPPGPKAQEAVDAEARAVFEEDVNAFVEDQLRFACRLALAEEQLLSVAHSFKNSTCATRHCQDAWPDDLNLLGCVEDARGATQAVSAELSSSLVLLRRHGKEMEGCRSRPEARQGGDSLRSHLAAFHQESAIERNARADLRAEWTQSQSEMLRKIDMRMQTIEQGVDQRFEALNNKFVSLEQRVRESDLAPGVAREGGHAELSESLSILKDAVKEQVLERERIRESVAEQVKKEAALVASQQCAQFEDSFRQLETSIRCQESRTREILEVLEQQVQRGSTGSSGSSGGEGAADVHGKDIRVDSAYSARQLASGLSLQSNSDCEAHCKVMPVGSPRKESVTRPTLQQPSGSPLPAFRLIPSASATKANSGFGESKTSAKAQSNTAVAPQRHTASLVTPGQNIFRSSSPHTGPTSTCYATPCVEPEQVVRRSPKTSEPGAQQAPFLEAFAKLPVPASEAQRSQAALPRHQAKRSFSKEASPKLYQEDSNHRGASPNAVHSRGASPNSMVSRMPTRGDGHSLTSSYAATRGDGRSETADTRPGTI